MDSFNKVVLVLIILFLGVVVGPLLLIAGINLIGGAAVAGFSVPVTAGSWFGAFLVVLILGASGKS